MSRIDELIRGLSPDGVNFASLSDIAVTLPGLTGKTKTDFADGNARFASYRNIYSNPSLNFESPDFVKVGHGERQNSVREGDILITGSSESLDEVGMSSVVVATPPEPIYLNSFCFILRLNQPQLLLPAFSKHLFRSESVRKQIRGTASGVTRINISKPRFMKIQIPVPPLPVQREIVRILDEFLELSALLEAELDARRRQYDYVLYNLTSATQPDGNLKPQWSSGKLGEVCTIEKGATQIQKASPGEYPLVVTALERRSSANFQFDAEALCVPLVSSKGHGVASISRVYFQSGRFALGNILAAIIPIDPQRLSAEFLYRYFETRKDYLLAPLMRGGANVSLSIGTLSSVRVSYPPMEEQRRILFILQCLKDLIEDDNGSLTAELAYRRAQYKYYRDKILTFEEAAG